MPPSEMTNTDWQAYLGQLVDALKLYHYEYTLHFGGQGLGNNDLAKTLCIDDRRFVHITIGRLFEDAPPEMQRHALVHELIHVILNPADQVVQRLKPVLGVAAGQIVSDSFVHELELAVDQLANALAPFLPTPGVEMSEVSSDA